MTAVRFSARTRISTLNANVVVVSLAPRPVHGQKSLIDMTPDEPVFEGLGSTLTAARYHSLVVTEVPDSMKVIASTRDGGETGVSARAPVPPGIHSDAVGTQTTLAFFR